MLRDVATQAELSFAARATLAHLVQLRAHAEQCVHLQTSPLHSMASGSRFVDALPLLEAALVDLAPGQLIRDERVQLMDLMSAAEVR